MLETKKAIIFGGGTLEYVRPHLALCSPASGRVAHLLHSFVLSRFADMEVTLLLSTLAGGTTFTSSSDLRLLVDRIISDLQVKVIFFPAAVCDFTGEVQDGGEPGKYGTRLASRGSVPPILLTAVPKIVSRIRATRKDITLVAFKTTCGDDEQTQYLKGLALLKEASANLVFANDTKTRLNMVITPEEAKYHVTHDRYGALAGLVEMTKLRSNLTFTRSTVVDGQPVAWDSAEVPANLREVVNFCIQQNAYKPFNGMTVGHFAAKISPTEFLTSMRKTNFNDLAKNGMVRIRTDGPDSIIAYGAKPSVGGQSQRIVFDRHPEMDCIVHFHCPIRPGSKVPVVSQREYECGSHECGRNTATSLQGFKGRTVDDPFEHRFYAVYLDQHGPNIVFWSKTPAGIIIRFIQENFDLSQKTGGPVSLTSEAVTM